MPQHRGVFDSMKPDGLLLDHPEEWRGSSLILAHCSLDTCYSLNYTQPSFWKLLFGTCQNSFRNQNYYCVVEHSGKAGDKCPSLIPTFFDSAHRHSQGTQACGTWKLLANSSKKPDSHVRGRGEGRELRGWEDLRGPWIVKALKNWILWKSWSEILICAETPFLALYSVLM